MADEKKTQDKAADKAGGDTAATVPPPPARDPRVAYRAIAFTIEFATDQNNRVTWTPTKQTYRGRWVPSNIRGPIPDDTFVDMPELPGQIAVFSGADCTGVIRDPLRDPAFKPTLLRAKKAIKDTFRGESPEPEEDKAFRGLTPDKLKEWVYWARRCLDNGWAVLRAGRVPPMEDIVGLPGRVEINKFDSSPRRDKHATADMDIPPYAAPARAGVPQNPAGDLNDD